MGIPVTWTADDGYVSNDRPQQGEIEDDDIDGGMSDEEVEDILNRWVQSEFEMTVTPSIKDYDEVLAQMIAVRDAKKREE